MVIGEEAHGMVDLLEVAHAPQLESLALESRKTRNCNGHEKGQDRDGDEQLDQGKPSPVLFLST